VPARDAQKPVDEGSTTNIPPPTGPEFVNVTTPLVMTREPVPFSLPVMAVTAPRDDFVLGDRGCPNVEVVAKSMHAPRIHAAFILGELIAFPSKTVAFQL